MPTYKAGIEWPEDCDDAKKPIAVPNLVIDSLQESSVAKNVT